MKGQVVAITGGASGIGRALARAVAARGGTPITIDVDDRADIVADVTDLDALEAAFAELDRVDVLVANAGIGPRATTVIAGDREHQRRVLDVNLHGVWHTLWAGGPRVVEAGGHIVIVSSVAAFVPSPAFAAYAASKAAVEALARAVRIELAPQGATVGVAHFGLVDTPLVADFAADVLTAQIERLAPGLVRHRVTAEAAAEALARGIERRAARTVFPGGWWLPYLLRGALGPVADAVLARDPRMRRLLREIAARDGTRVEARR